MRPSRGEGRCEASDGLPSSSSSQGARASGRGETNRERGSSEPRGEHAQGRERSFRKALRTKQPQLVQAVTREVTKMPREKVKIRKIAKKVLEDVFTLDERGAGRWSELVEREPVLLQSLVSAMRRSSALAVRNSEVSLARKKTTKNRNLKRDPSG
mmetsp:Transcript_8727/g.22503  ORF Transcript_8727/g.22503 Transcript_8727/m.22503 type:complete len:156 (-) Transcript_8727:61-528(-)